MRKIITSTLILFSVASSTAQTIFQNIYNGSFFTIGNSGIQTNDGGYLFAGSTGAAFNYSGAALVKTNSNGDTLWTKTFDGPQYDFFKSIMQTSDGGYIAAGGSQSYLQLGVEDYYLVKLDSMGTISWSKSYGGPNASTCTKVIETMGGGYLMVGYSNNTTPGAADLFVIKTNAVGDTLWTRSFGNNFNTSASDVYQDVSGDIMILGSILIPGFPNDLDILLIKLNSNGAIKWIKTYGATPPEQTAEYGIAMAATIDGGTVIGGYGFGWGAGAHDAFLIRIDSAGAVQWGKSYGGVSNEILYDVAQMPDSGYVFSGYSQSIVSNQVAYAVRTNAVGDTLWTRAFVNGVSSELLSVNNADDGGLIFTGVVRIGAGSGVPYIYAIKTDAGGNSGCSEYSTPTVVSTTTPVEGSEVLNYKAGLIYINNTETFPYFSSVSTICFSSAIAETMNDEIPFSVYPNPSDGMFQLQLNSTIKGECRFKVFDAMGKELYHESLSDIFQKEINLNNIKAGIYFARIIYEGKYYCKKIIVQP